MHFPKVAQYKSVDAFRKGLLGLGIDLPCDEKILSRDEGSPLGQAANIGTLVAGNRWCIHPMEGWDGTRDGRPSDLTYRRWRRFGESGAKLIWGGEAAAVQADGRANPNQLMAIESCEAGLRDLLQALRVSHRERHGSTDDLVVGLQLTHSGRFSRPNGKMLEPRIAYHHPILDGKFGIDPLDDHVVWTDSDLERLIESYVESAKIAQRVGFQFVDIKACHGYLLHEFLSARSRPGLFGGDLQGRSRLLLTIIQRVQECCPRLEIGVRLSVFDTVPYRMGEEHGEPMNWSDDRYVWGFGCDEGDPNKIDLTEPIMLIRELAKVGVSMINVTAGSPYYTPHIQRPASFPPSDGYLPPEDPLLGVARQINVVRSLKEQFPKVWMVGSGYTYLQDYLVNAAQSVVREGWVDFVGLGRMVLSYPTLPADSLNGNLMERKKVCRTFSDCTSAPRNGLESGCYPLDPFYKALPQAAVLKETLKKKE